MTKQLFFPWGQSTIDNKVVCGGEQNQHRHYCLTLFMFMNHVVQKGYCTEFYTAYILSRL